MKTRTMTRTQAELLLAAVIIARSTSYVLTKVGLQDMGKFTLLAVRFLLAFAFLAVLFWRRLLQIDRRTLLSGLAMGGIYFCVMTAELTALKTVETSTVSFVTNTAVVIVPLVQAVLSRRWPERRLQLGALACLLGVALLTLRNGLALTPGVGQHIGAVKQVTDLGNGIGFKCLGVICAVGAVVDLRLSKIRQILCKNVRCSVRIPHCGQLPDLVHGNGRDLGGDKQTAVSGNTLGNGGCTVYCQCAVSGTFIKHDDLVTPKRHLSFQKESVG